MRDDKNLFFEMEYAAFYENNYQALGEDYQNLYFSDDQTDRLYNVNVEKLHPNPVWDSIPHFANLRVIRDNCKQFWNDNLDQEQQKKGFYQKSQLMIAIPHDKKKFSALEYLVTRFKFEKTEQAEIVCGYLEHIFEKMLMVSEGGDFELFVLSQLASENLELKLEQIRKEVEQVLWLSFVAVAQEKHPAIDCETVLAMDLSIPFETAKEICFYYIDKEVSQFLTDLYDNCENNSPAHSLDLTDLQMVTFCTLNQGKEVSYSTLLDELYTELQAIYNFAQNESFSSTKLALKQLTISALTNNTNKYLKESSHPKSLSLYDWNPAVFAKPFEFAYFSQKFNFGEDLIKALDLSTSTAIMNKSSLFNVLVLYNSVVKAQNGDFAYFEQFFKLDKVLYSDFWSMLVLFVRESYLKGFFTQVTSKDIEDGFDIDFIEDFRIRPILLGGDPSLPDPVAVRLQKSVYVFEKFTGQDDFMDVDNFISVNNQNSISNSLPIFNGNVTSILYSNPWGADIPMSGCDNFCSEKSHGYQPTKHKSQTNPKEKTFKGEFLESILDPTSVKLGDGPQSDTTLPRTISVYGSPINRTIDYEFVKTDKTTFMNLDTNHYKMVQEQYKATHPEYHQNIVNGFLNMTNVFNFPILFSQNHHSQVDDRMKGKFKYFDKAGNVIEPNEERDGGKYTTEARSHGVTQMVLQLHFNAEIQPNLKLFIGKEQQIEHLRADPTLPIIVPLYNLEYYTGLNEQKYRNIFGKVSAANTFLEKYFAIFVTLFLILLVLFCCSGYLWYREYQKVNRENGFLEESGREELLDNDEGQDN